MITTGGQQNCDYTAKLFLEPGDVVISEEPSFPCSFNTFHAYGAAIAGVPLESDGMRVADFRRVAEENPNARMLYITPNFHNPTGRTTSLAKRREIYEIAREFDLVVFEDDPYGELRFSGEDVMPIKSLDTDGRVMYGGSFSKTLAPGLRLGYLVYDKAIGHEVSVAKQTTDVHTNTLFQRAAYEMLMNGYEEHLAFCREIYMEKCRTMREALREYAPEGISWNAPEGGFFLSLYFPEGLDANDFALRAIDRGVACVPGSSFTIDGHGSANILRLCYATVKKEQIAEGIRILCDFAKEWLAGAG